MLKEAVKKEQHVEADARLRTVGIQHPYRPAVFIHFLFSIFIIWVFALALCRILHNLVGRSSVVVQIVVGITHTSVAEEFLRVSITHVDVRSLHIWNLNVIAVWVGVGLQQYSFVQVAGFFAFGRIRETKGLRGEGRLRSIVITHRTILLVAFLTLVFNFYLGLIVNTHANLVNLLANKELVAIFRGNGHLVALEVANKVSKGLCACINTERK